jgi:hypothetical protein
MRSPKKKATAAKLRIAGAQASVTIPLQNC